MSRIRHPLSLILLALKASIVSGCGRPEASAGDRSVSVIRVGDTAVVTSVAKTFTDTARLLPVARIGRLDGPDEFLLDGVWAFAVGMRGEVYVSDSEGIKVFSADGSSVREVARDGRGPGEVRSPSGLEVDDAGRLLVVDQGNNRVAVLDTSGAVLDHWRLPAGRPGTGRSAIIPNPEGVSLLALNPTPTNPPSPYPRPIFLRLDPRGNVLDTIFAPARLGEACPVLDDPAFSGGMWQDLREPMFPKVKWTASRQGHVVFGCPEDYVIDRVRPSGEVVRVILERDPWMASEGEREDFVESWNWYASFTWTGPPPPEKKPYYHRMIVGRGGRLWVWPGYLGEARSFDGVVHWVDPNTGAFDVFAETGEYLGPVLLPKNAEYRPFPGTIDPYFAGDTVWVVTRDTLDVQYIDRFMIQW